MAPYLVTEKCQEIIELWLEGQGAKPVTWETLIQVLEKMKLIVLSDQLRQTLD